MQTTFGDMEYSRRKRNTKRDKFLQTMDEVIPWSEFESIIKPHYFQNKRGRKATPIIKMLKMLFLQQWYNLSDEGVEDAIYDSYSFRTFMRINFLEEQAPDATTLCKFRHLLEEKELGKQIFDKVAQLLKDGGFMVENGTCVDATIIAAPSSTKNEKKERDPEMHSTQKGNDWYFGMKEHIGVDALNGFVHSCEATAANVHDVNVGEKLVRETDDVVFGDSGYLGLPKRMERDDIEFRICTRPSSLKQKTEFGINWDREIESRKASTRCKVEYVFLIVKRIFGMNHTRYRGLQKNHNMFQLAFATANIYMLASSGRKFLNV